MRFTILGGVLVAACSPLITPSGPSSGATRPGPIPSNPVTAPTTTVIPAGTITPCVRNGTAALGGVLDARPDGWSDQGATPGSAEFPATNGRVYGPIGPTIPPYEGPGRIALYETFPASDAYFRSRIEQSRDRNGQPIAASVCGEATAVWLDEATGELIVGWTDRDKSDVLVANTADFTIQELVDMAERVSDCCG